MYENALPEMEFSKKDNIFPLMKNSKKKINIVVSSKDEDYLFHSYSSTICPI